MDIWIFDQYKSAASEAGVNDGRTPNRCNLVDATFAAAKKLSRENTAQIIQRLSVQE